MDGKNYSAVPPPPSLSASKGSSSLDFNDALSKARAIAEKLKQQTPSTTDSSAAALGSGSSYSSGKVTTTHEKSKHTTYLIFRHEEKLQR